MNTIDTRVYKYIGTSADSTGVFKVRFGNDYDQRMKIMASRKQSDVKMIELPTAMTKMDASKWLMENKPEGINLDAVKEKIDYLSVRIAKANGTHTAKRGRPAKKHAGKETTINELNTNEQNISDNSIAKTIVNAAKGNSIRAKVQSQVVSMKASK